MINNFLMGGKLGDFLHSMFAVRGLCKKNNIKANIHVYNIGWEFGFEKTVQELTPILLQQDYIQSVSMLTDCHVVQDQTSELGKNYPTEVFDKKLLKEGYIELGDYIRSPLLYRACWSELYADTFDFPLPEKNEYKWINYNKINITLQDKILVHRRNNPVRINPEFPYQDILNLYKDNMIFVSTNEEDYKNFEYKDQLPFLKINSLDEWFTAVNSCAVMISNLSSPAVMAHAMDKVRIIELPYTADAYHCIGEEKYSSKAMWYWHDAAWCLSNDLAQILNKRKGYL
jgi:hypothetical protein